MNKEKIKEKVIENNKAVYLSAQDYDLLTNNEKKALREALKEEGKDADDYEKEMKKLWPKKVVFNTKWRNR